MLITLSIVCLNFHFPHFYIFIKEKEEDDFFWNDYEDYDYDNYVEISEDDPKYYKPEPRINYELFGFDSEDEDSDERNVTLYLIQFFVNKWKDNTKKQIGDKTEMRKKA